MPSLSAVYTEFVWLFKSNFNYFSLLHIYICHTVGLSCMKGPKATQTVHDCIPASPGSVWNGSLCSQLSLSFLFGGLYFVWDPQAMSCVEPRLLHTMPQDLQNLLLHLPTIGISLVYTAAVQSELISQDLPSLFPLWRGGSATKVFKCCFLLYILTCLTWSWLIKNN